MAWSYDPEDTAEVKHRDALRNELPEGAMRSEPTSEEERRDLWFNGDPMLRYHTDKTIEADSALAQHRRDTHQQMLRDLMDTGHHDVGEALQHAHMLEPAGPGDHLLNPAPHDLSEMDDEDEEREDEPYYRVWHESGDYVGGSGNLHKARGIMGGSILNHRYEDPECPGCGVMTPPADHGFSIQPVNGAEDSWDDDLSPRFSRVMGSVGRQTDTIWR